MVEPGEHGRLMPEIAGEVDNPHPFVVLHELVKYLTAVVAAAVVDEQQLEVGGIGHGVDDSGYFLVK